MAVRSKISPGEILVVLFSGLLGVAVNAFGSSGIFLPSITPAVRCANRLLAPCEIFEELLFSCFVFLEVCKIVGCELCFFSYVY